MAASRQTASEIRHLCIYWTPPFHSCIVANVPFIAAGSRQRLRTSSKGILMRNGIHLQNRLARLDWGDIGDLCRPSLPAASTGGHNDCYQHSFRLLRSGIKTPCVFPGKRRRFQGEYCLLYI
jgi:hypothetical protein